MGNNQIMFGRVRRAAAAASLTEHITAAAVLGVYSPETIAGALAVGMGSAALGSGAAMARRADGTQVSAVSEAVNGTMNWGRREQRRYLRLPGHVLVLVASDAVIIREWTAAKGMGRELARWPQGTFTATPIRDIGKVGARVTLDSGKIAILSGNSGPFHHATRATTSAIITLARQPSA